MIKVLNHFFSTNRSALWFDRNRFIILGVSVLMFFMFPTFLETVINPWISQAIYISLIVLASINLMQSVRRKIIFSMLGVVAFSLLWGVRLFGEATQLYEIFLFGSFTVFFSVIAYNLFGQMRRIEKIDEAMVIASVTGYLLLGTLAFLTFCITEMLFPGSFTITEKLISEHQEIDSLVDMTKYSKHIISDLFYFSFISMSTIGYGDIYPISQVAKKVAILIGIIGPFYMAIVVATLVGKSMSNESSKSRKH